MYLSKVTIKGYKAFSDEFSIDIPQGLCVILGENGTGKSSVIDAIRVLFQEDEYGRAGISESDFHRDFGQGKMPCEAIELKCEFNGLDEIEQATFLPWLKSEEISSSILNLRINNKQTNRGYYRKEYWGGESTASAYESELFERFNCVYLPPLRDAEQKLCALRGSRLSRLFRNLHQKDLDSGKKLAIEEKVAAFNNDLAENEDAGIKRVTDLIQGQLRKALGEEFSQTTTIQFSETSFTRIVENLRLLFFPEIRDGNSLSIDQYRDLNQNSLGYNNLLYLATILAEFEGLRQSDDTQFLKILLIEEPEAHLHPQLQQRLMSFFKKATENNKIQVIMTTHSPVIAATTELDNLVVMTRSSSNHGYQAVNMGACVIAPTSKDYLRKWLDITKSTMLFSRGVILVEGISEALLLPQLFKNYLQGEKPGDDRDLSSFGISVINVNGINFEHFIRIFSEWDVWNKEEENRKTNVAIRCAVITDKDPVNTEDEESEEKTGNAILKFESKIESSDYCRIFSNTKTFEYDLALVKENAVIMANVLYDMFMNPCSNRNAIEQYKVKVTEGTDKQQVAKDVLSAVKSRGKADFALKLADSPNAHDLVVPEYIKNAFDWVVKHEPKD